MSRARAREREREREGGRHGEEEEGKVDAEVERENLASRGGKRENSGSPRLFGEYIYIYIIKERSCWLTAVIKRVLGYLDFGRNVKYFSTAVCT